MIVNSGDQAEYTEMEVVPGDQLEYIVMEGTSLISRYTLRWRRYPVITCSIL